MKNAIQNENYLSVNKLKQYSKLMSFKNKCLIITKYRRCGKSTMINDLKFLYEQGNIYLFYLLSLLLNQTNIFFDLGYDNFK
jgi:hypothetical protein